MKTCIGCPHYLEEECFCVSHQQFRAPDNPHEWCRLKDDE